MAINSDSRYINAILQTIKGPDGASRQEMAIPFPVSYQIQYTFYQFKEGDRPDTLAARFFGNAQLWWVIANANPEIMQWLDIPVGTVIRVPSA